MQKITYFIGVLCILTLGGCTEANRLMGALGFGNPDPAIDRVEKAPRRSVKCCWCVRRDQGTNVLSKYIGEGMCEANNASNEFVTCRKADVYAHDCNLLRVWRNYAGELSCMPRTLEYKTTDGTKGFIDPPSDSESICGRELVLNAEIKARIRMASTPPPAGYVETPSYCTCTPHPDDSTRCIATRWVGLDREELGVMKIPANSYCSASECQNSFKSTGTSTCGEWRNY